MTAIPLTVLSVSISPDYSTITIITNSEPIDISTTSVGVSFRPGTLITPDGVLYNSVSSTVELQNPVFVSSYYQAYGKDVSSQALGIALVVTSAFLLISSLFLGNEETVN